MSTPGRTSVGAPPAAPPGRRRPTGPILVGLGIAATGLAAYANSFAGPFVFLDLAAIVDNPTIRHLWPPGQALHPPVDGSLTVGGRPLLNWSLALNYAVSGVQPWSYHLVNVLIHLAAGLTLFGIVRRTFAGSGPATARASVPVAALAALIWTVHPLQTESVTYVIQRAESLMGLCYLLTLYCFIRRVEGGPPAWSVLCWLACLAGMATKEVMVSAPVLVLLYDRTFVTGSGRAALRRRPGFYAALAATWLPLLWFVHSTGGNRGGTSGFGLPISWWRYFVTQFPAIVHYLKLALWPHPLVFYYAVSWPAFGAVAGRALVVVALALVTAAGLWRRAAWGFLGAWFFAILSPTSLVPGMSQTLAEHRMYLPLAAVWVGLVAAAWRVASVWPGLRPLCTGGFLLVAGAFAVLTARRNTVYRSELTLWGDTVAKVASNPYTQNNLGIALAGAGRPQDAQEHFRRALALDPDYPEAEDNLGQALAAAGEFAAATAHYAHAVALRPNYPEALANWGVALANLGRLPEARGQFERALQLDPGFLPARNDLAVTLASLGQLPEAVDQYNEVLRRGGTTPELQYNLGNALAELGRWTEAADHYQQAVEQRLDYVEAWANLGVALAKSGREGDAVGAYQQALRLTPQDPEIHYNLALALRDLGRADEAAAEFAAAERLRGGAQKAAP